ncbi:MAG: ABC transporter ATP-binding protein [Candidatus Hydrogenedentes bacterium]|nr:ABC transporter ATP-binding protein [Candidatus Hydrogenedentota bacterium]
MARIELDNLSHAYGTDASGAGFAIQRLNLCWEDGTANALLGPSGCGKTTLLNIISGLLRPGGGRVLFDGVDVTGKSARERHIAQVFQFPVVYEAMSVFDNLAFPLRNRGVAESSIKPRVNDIAELLGLNGLLQRKSKGLTPAEKQKVSLGRGLVREDTAAVLFDEPLTIIDPKEKYDLRRSLRDVQRALKMTMIYVTHDQHEALTFADRVTVMKDGAIQQTGTPDELHRNPATPFVGFFIGSPGMNFFDVEFQNGACSVGEMVVPVACANAGPARLGIRPEFVEVREDAAANCLHCRIRVVEDTGVYKVLTLETESQQLKARVPERFAPAEGAAVWVWFREEALRIFPAQGEARP